MEGGRLRSMFLEWERIHHLIAKHRWRVGNEVKMLKTASEKGIGELKASVLLQLSVPSEKLCSTLVTKRKPFLRSDSWLNGHFFNIYEVSLRPMKQKFYWTRPCAQLLTKFPNTGKLYNSLLIITLKMRCLKDRSRILVSIQLKLHCILAPISRSFAIFRQCHHVSTAIKKLLFL